MEKIFLQVINMSITATYVILFVIIFRLFLKKVPKIFSYALWAIVFLRLILPFSFESTLSLMPRSRVTLTESIINEQSAKTNNNIAIIDNEIAVIDNSEEKLINNDLNEENTDKNLAPITTSNNINFMNKWFTISSIIWIIGLGSLLIYSLVSSLKLSQKLKSTRLLYDNIYEIYNIKTPFVFGILNPKIYLPTNLSESEKSYIIQHELIHIKRYDNIVKFLAFLILSIHWFNPFAWLAFFLMVEDMELSCDELVIRKLGNDIKKAYSSSLLSLSIGRKIIGASPIAFGENNIKARIKNILNYKKPSFWIVIISVIVLIMAILGLLSNPKRILMDNRTIEDYVKEHLEEDIKFYESYSKIVESKITKIEKLSTFDTLFPTPVELWSIEYRMKPEDINKITDKLDIGTVDGWITETGYRGRPLMILTHEDGRLNKIKTVYSNELDLFQYNMNKLLRQEIAIRTVLENDGLLPKETYSGQHVVINFTFSNGEACKMLLSQPVIQGNKGIWAVERLMDGSGMIYHEYPNTDMKTKDYYKSLQKQYDNGDKLYLGDVAELGYKYILENLNLNDTTIRKSDLIVKNPASIEDFIQTPISQYIAYVVEISSDMKQIDIDYVEWLTQKNMERLKELSIDSISLPNGFYIHNPNVNTYSFTLSDETEYYVLNWNELNGEFDSPKSVTKEELIDYIDSLAYKPLFNIFTKDGYVIKIEERYVP